MSWKELPDGSYANSEFPCKLVLESGIPKLEILAGAVNRKLPLDDLWNNPLLPATSTAEFEIYEEVFPQGTDAGGSVAGFNKRNLNSWVNTGVAWATAPSGGAFQITVTGYYAFWFYSSGYNNILEFKSVLRDTTAPLDFYGGNVRCGGGSATMVESHGFAWMYLTTPTTFELSTYAKGTEPIYGLGVANNQSGVQEKYCQIMVQKVG